MDTLSRLIATLFVTVALMLCATQARAQNADLWVMTYGTGCGAGSVFTGSSPSAAGSAYLAASNACNGFNYTIGSCTTPSLSGPQTSASATCQAICITDPGGNSCSQNNTTLSAGITCSSGKNLTPESPLSCVTAAPTGCAANAGQATSTFVPQGSVNGVTAYYGTCANGCGITITGTGQGPFKQGGQVGTVFTGVWSGSGCSVGSNGTGPAASQPVTPQDPPTPCTNGYFGVVNGVESCIPAPPGQPTGSTTSVSASSSGASVTAPGGDPTPGEASTTSSTSTTTCKDGQCTTTTTTSTQPINPTTGAASGGATVTATTQQQPAEDFCAKNPQNNLCKTSTITGGGNCLTPITSCNGDAVMCAIAREQLRQFCEMNPSSELASLGSSMVAGTANLANDPRAPGNIPVVNMANVIDQTDLLPGTCPANPTFSIMGKSMTIPYDALCPYLAMMGNIAVFAAMLAAAYTIFAGSKS